LTLPGVNTIIKDRFYAVSRIDVPRGPKVVILGRRTTVNGTVDSSGRAIYDLDVYNVSSEQELGTVFGVQSDLVRGYLEVLAGGATRVSVVALPADTTFNHTAGTISSATYTADGGTDLWGDAWSAIESAEADIVVPWGRGSNSTDWDDYATPATPGTTEFGFYADNSATVANSWAFLVATEVEAITQNAQPLFAVMGIQPWVGQSDTSGGMTPANVASHVGGAISGLVDKNGASMGSLGSYLSIVATEIKPLGYEDNYSWGWSNGAGMYAGYITQLDSWSAPTAKRIFNVASLRYLPTRTQQLNISDLGLVPVALNFQREAVWVDATTFANDLSQYKRLTTVRIVNDAIQLVRNIAQNFIGEAATLEIRNALETGITNGLMGMQRLGALMSSDFTVTYFPADSKAVVDLVLTPAFELRNIEVQVSLNL